MNQKKSAFETVLSQIKKKIMSKEWAPGERIPTLQQLSNEFSVSVTTIREALRTLESQDIISIEHGRGMYVRNDPLIMKDNMFNLKEMGQVSLVSLLESRLLIEPELAALCAQNASTADINKLRLLAEQMNNQMETGGPFLDTDLAFHQVIAKGASNLVLQRMMDSIEPLLIEGRFRTNTLPNMRTKASNYHQLIAIAIEERQKEQARLLMHSHITEMLHSLIA